MFPFSNVNGIIMPVKEIGKITRERGILFLVDASQGAGSIKLDVQEINADLFAVPGHKDLLGPQGVGALYVNENVEITPIMQGVQAVVLKVFINRKYSPICWKAELECSRHSRFGIWD